MHSFRVSFRLPSLGSMLSGVGSLGALGIGLVVSCVPAGDGVPPPEARLYFPVALTVDRAFEHLLVVSSDFDLQFNQGTVHSLDLDEVRAWTMVPCNVDTDCKAGLVCDDEPTEQNDDAPSYTCVAEAGEFALEPCPVVGAKSVSLRASAPGRCAPVQLSDSRRGTQEGLVADIVTISAFASDAVLAKKVDDSGTGPTERLFVPVRGDSSLHWFDLEKGKLNCGQKGRGSSCANAYRISNNPNIIPDAEVGDILETPSEPYGVAATADGKLIAVTHQQGGAVSAYENDWEWEPRLVDVARGLPDNVIGVAALPPRQGNVEELNVMPPGFLVTFRQSATVQLLRYFDPELLSEFAPTATNPRLLSVASTPITVNTSGLHSRSIAVDDSVRGSALAACGENDADCLGHARAVPLDIYVANRSPNSLLIGRTDRIDSSLATVDLPTFHNNVPLTEGPSQVVVGHVLNRWGEPEQRVFIVCFDSALIYVFDPQAGRIESVFFTGSGPQSIVFDNFDAEQGEVRPLLYVAHFTDSYVGVLSLDQRYPRTYGSTLATIGVPTPPRASK